MKLTKDQIKEISNCSEDFSYFCEKYIKIDKDSNKVPFKLYPYQLRLYEHLEDNRLSIFSKFRQGGFTTELAIYCLWRCLFGLDQKVLWLSQQDRSLVDVCDRIIKGAIEDLPDWMTGNVIKMLNSHQKSFPETGSIMRFSTPDLHSGMNFNLLVIDEASFISDMDKHWKSIWPILSTGGRAIVYSTVNYDNDWFWTTMEDAVFNLNSFSVYQSRYWERPEYCDVNWEKSTKKHLGQKMWDVEYEQKPMYKTPSKSSNSKTPQKKLWRSIWDEWDSSSGLAEDSF